MSGRRTSGTSRASLGAQPSSKHPRPSAPNAPPPSKTQKFIFIVVSEFAQISKKGPIYRSCGSCPDSCRPSFRCVFLGSRCLFCGIEVAQVSFLVSRSLFRVEIRKSVLQHLDCLLPGINPYVLFWGLDILRTGGQKNLDTKKKIEKSRYPQNLGSAPPHTGSPRPFGPEPPKESEKSPERVPLGQGPKGAKRVRPGVSKESEKSPKPGAGVVLGIFRSFLGLC